MSVCLHRGIASKPITIRPPPDVFALVSGGSGLALIYAALDQGNRLDWLNSGLVWGLLLAGALLLIAFLIHEAVTPRPLVNLKVVFGAPMPSQFMLIAFLRLTILSTAYLIPLFLGSVRGFRALEVGDTLIWIAIPQLIVCLLAALMLRRSDPRLVASIGFIFISVACLMVAYNLTPIWGSDQFLPSQLLQSVGQSFALSGVVFFGILHLRPQDALTFGAVLQTARLMGGEIGSAFVVTLARVREQVASNLIGQHVQLGDAQVIQRVRAYGAVTTRVFDPTGAADRGQQVLGNVVRAAATTQSVIDAFVAVGLLTALTLLIIVFRKAAPEGPASAPRLFSPRAPDPS
jgi:DHA2 family multidrug resistance protein